MRVSWLGPAVLVLTAAATIGYWAIQLSQETGLGWGPVIVSALLLVPGAGCAIGSSNLLPGPVRAAILGWSAMTLLALAGIAFSIGLALLPIAALAVVVMVIGVGSAKGAWGLPAAAFGGALGVATIVAFLSLEPYLPPQCPNHQPGRVVGGTDYQAGLLTPAVHISWVCEDGRLVTYQTSH
jgi:hypothetical protein